MRWLSGFETGDATLEETEFGTAGNLANFSFETTIVRSGLRAGKFTGPGFFFVPFLTGTVTGIYARAYVYLVGTPAATTRLIGFNNDTGALSYASVWIKTNRTLEFRINVESVDLIATSITVLATATWYRLEMYVDVTSGRGGARIDGVPFCDQAMPFTTTGTLGVVFVGPADANSTTILYDDCAVNDTFGGSNNTWCGPGRVVTAVPAVDIGATAWTAQTGGAKYDQINDLPAASVDTTTYIKETTGAVNAAQGFAFTDPGLDGGIRGVLVGVRSVGTDDPSRLSQFRWRDAAGFELSGSTLDFGQTTARTVYPAWTAEEAWDGTQRTLTPRYLGIGGTWEGTTATTRPHGLAVRTDALVREIRWSAVWATIDVMLPVTPITSQDRWAPRVLLEIEVP